MRPRPPSDGGLTRVQERRHKPLYSMIEGLRPANSTKYISA